MFTWVVNRVVSSVLDPLDEHEESQVEEEEYEENNLGNELAEDVDPALKVQVVEEADDDAKQHVQHAKDYRDLHFVRVEEDDLVLGQLPDWIHAKWIGMLNVVGRRVEHYQPIHRYVIPSQTAHVPIRPKYIERFGEHVVVYQSCER